MKENWQYKRLGEVCEILDSKRRPITKSQRIPGSIPYYGASGVQDYVKDFIFEGRFLLIGEDGAKWGQNENSAYIIEGKSWVNNHVHILKMKDNIMDVYAQYYLNKSDLNPYITGAVVPKLTQSSLVNILIPVPPLSEQEKIVAELDLLSGIIEKQKQQLKELDTLAQSIFYSMFGDPISNEKNWPIKKLEEVCSKITDGTHDTPERISEGVKFITGKHIRPFYVDYDNSDYVSESVHKQIYTRCNPEKGDVLYTNIGVGVGTAAVNTVNYEFSMKNVALLKIRNLINGVYLQYVLNDFNFKKFILPTFLGGGAQSFLSLKQIKLLPVILPPFELQNEFAEKIEKIEKQKEIINKSIEETQKLFDYTMDKYFG